MPTGLFELIPKAQEEPDTIELHEEDSEPIELGLHGDTSQFDAVTPHGMNTGDMVPLRDPYASAQIPHAGDEVRVLGRGTFGVSQSPRGAPWGGG